MQLNDCIFFTANSLLKTIQEIMEPGFQQLGISSSYAYMILTIEQHENIGTVELANELNLKPSTVTRLVDKMVIQGYVTRKSVGKRTRINCSLKGKMFAKQIIHTMGRMRSEMEEKMGTETMQNINRQLLTYKEGLETKILNKGNSI